MSGATRLIGVISDTHGLLRPAAVEALRGAELILHAGDIGGMEVIAGLEAVAPVRAIRGNTDTDRWAARFPETEAIEVAGNTLYIIHNRAELDLDPRAAGFRAVIYGHTHRPAAEEKNGVLYLNPGAAGPRRFSLPISVALLRVSRDSIEHQIVSLEE